MVAHSQGAKAPSTLLCLESAYLALLQLPHNIVRFRQQPTLCALRDAIASYRGLDGETVQNEYEERALRVRFAQSDTEAKVPTPNTNEDGYRVFKDGNAWCATGEGFVNLQESKAGFGHTPLVALGELIVEEGEP